MKSAFIFLMLVFLISCRTEQIIYPSEYLLPDEKREIELSRTVNVSSETLWKRMLDHISASSLFKIENFEQDSRLITLSLKTSNMAPYIDCGHWKSTSFEGPYIDYRKIDGAELSVTISVLIDEIEEKMSVLTVNTIYSVTDGNESYEFNALTNDVLNIDNPVIGTGPRRKCQATNFIERKLLSLLDENSLTI
jgi:hypothetical protein